MFLILELGLFFSVGGRGICG